MGPYPLTESNVEAIHVHQVLDTIQEDNSQEVPAAAAGALPGDSLKAGWLSDTKYVAAESVASTTRGVIDEQQEQRRLFGEGHAPDIPPVEGTQTSEPPLSKCRLVLNWKLWMLLGILVIGVGVVIYIIVSSSLRKSSNFTKVVVSTPSPSAIITDDFLPTEGPTASPTTRPSFRPSLSLDPMFQPSISSDDMELILFITDLVGESALVNGTAQNQAMQWILHDDPQDLSISNDGESRVKQRFLLAILHFQLNGDYWLADNFMSSDDECNWDGIRCNKAEIVHRILLDSANLTGSLPEEIGLLAEMQWISFHNNSLSGAIPDSLYALPSLTWLDMGQNMLTGQLSSELWHMQSLNVFWVDNNLLTGPVPEVTKFTIPLLDFDASFNRLGGSVPLGLWGLTNLTFLYLNGNLLEGSVPPFANDSPLKLQALWLQDNLLEGALPESLSMLTSIEKVVLYRNAFTTTVPISWFTMPSLLYLDLSENSLSGTIPNLANSPSIAHLFLNNNSFWGSLPENLPPSVIDAWFQYNTFTGEIPPQFGVGFENLTELLLHGNGLSGELSSDLCDSGIRLEADCLNDGSEKSIQCECCQCY